MPSRPGLPPLSRRTEATQAQRRADSGEVARRDGRAEPGVADQHGGFNELTEAVLLHNLRQRYAVDEIYTSVGSILVAINRSELPIYTPDMMLKYINSGGKERAGRSDPLPPHCWQVAIRAYRALLSDFSNQAVCISGESGAGKTESMKLSCRRWHRYLRKRHV